MIGTLTSFDIQSTSRRRPLWESLQRDRVRRLGPLADPHAEAAAVAMEQLRYWRSEGVSNEDIYRVLTGAPAPHTITRDELLALVAAAWLGAAG
jgi:hypothetical protein